MRRNLRKYKGGATPIFCEEHELSRNGVDREGMLTESEVDPRPDDWCVHATLDRDTGETHQVIIEIAPKTGLRKSAEFTFHKSHTNVA